MDVNEKKHITKVAVLGAGVMGAQIAAHFVNAKIPVVLYDLPALQGNKSDVAANAIAMLDKLKPSPLACPRYNQYIFPANYEEHCGLLADCDLVIEAIAEHLELKHALYQKILPFLHPQAILATNTSGLSIHQLASVLPSYWQQRFCGIHFFNPPRYMHLVELIPHPTTNLIVFNFLESFLVSMLGKGIIIAKDTPNFIANRIGVFSLLTIFHHTEQFNLNFDIVDQLTGLLIGRAKSATYRTADIVGLDTLVQVIKNMQLTLADDPWSKYFTIPQWLTNLVQQGALGQKAGKGFYKKCGQEISVYNRITGEYTPQQPSLSDEIIAIFKNKSWDFRFQQLRASTHKEAQFLWAIFRDLFHYCSHHLNSIADNVRDVDLAMRWGYGWQQGAFEIWQLAGWHHITDWIKEDIAIGKSLINHSLPQWVTSFTGNEIYTDKGAYSPNTNEFKTRSNLPVYKRQLFPDPVLGENYNEGITLLETEAIRVWHSGDDIAVLSFKTKKNTISNAVLEGICQAIDFAEKNCKGLILWQRQGEHFSYGADLRRFLEEAQKGGSSFLEQSISLFQQTSLKLRYCQIPTIAALKGMVLGGGCELSLHCDKRVAALETYMGLVEIGVGLLPAGGGTKEMALRAAIEAGDKEVFDFLLARFKLIATARVSTSAYDAKDLGLFHASDVVILNAFELLYVAKQQIIALHEACYRPPFPHKFKVAGKEGIATLKSFLVNMREGEFISEYDFYLASKIAEVICGGYVDTGSIVDEAWLLRLECQTFIEFALQEKTRERILYTLERGKPLRN